MKRPVPMMFNTSLRLPRKMCGLFDTGSAGDTLDVTSMEYDAPNNFISSSCLLEGLKSADFPYVDVLADRKLGSVQQHLINTSNRMDLLSDIEIDQFANESLDAFINLDQLLNVYFGGIGDIEHTTTETIEMALTSFGSDIFHTKTSVEPEQYFYRAPIDDVGCELNMSEVYLHENKQNFSPSNHEFHEVVCPKVVAEIKDTQQHTAHCDEKGKPIDKTMLSCGEFRTCSDGLEVNIKRVVANKQTIIQEKKRLPSTTSQKQRKPTRYDLDEEAVKLTATNEKLRRRIIKLEKMTKEMKAQLIATVAGSGTISKS
uniref:BZIP domain-containing protein n=1 Tax=Arion vulgaris TaxID=1028688 RepID=A0A0B7APL2_9EUPU